MKLFEHIEIDLLDFDLTSETTENGRYYTTPEGNVYPSVTTVLSTYSKDGIDKWRKSVGEDQANKIMKMAANRGTNLHSICEMYLKNELSGIKMQKLIPDAKELFKNIRGELDKNLNNIYAIEQALYSDVLKVAGRVDCIAEWDGELAIIDFKSSTKLKKEEYIQNYFMQCTTYSEMFEELTGITINKIVVVISVQDENTSQIFVKDKRNYLNKTTSFIQNYHLTKAAESV